MTFPPKAFWLHGIFMRCGSARDRSDKSRGAFPAAILQRLVDKRVEEMPAWGLIFSDTNIYIWTNWFWHRRLCIRDGYVSQLWTDSGTWADIIAWAPEFLQHPFLSSPDWHNLHRIASSHSHNLVKFKSTHVAAISRNHSFSGYQDNLTIKNTSLQFLCNNFISCLYYLINLGQILCVLCLLLVARLTKIWIWIALETNSEPTHPKNWYFCAISLMTQRSCWQFSLFPSSFHLFHPSRPSRWLWLNTRGRWTTWPQLWSRSSWKLRQTSARSKTCGKKTLCRAVWPTGREGETKRHSDADSSLGHSAILQTRKKTKLL